MTKKQIIAIVGSLVGLVFLVIIVSALHMTRGTIESEGFCDFCHTAYYDQAEYDFNENVKMEKPSGVLAGCAECHPQPYAEFKQSAHFETEKEALRPGCVNCHAPHSFSRWLDYMYFSPPEWEKVQLSIHDNAFWEDEVRPVLAAKARLAFVADNSRFCKDCHIKNNFFNKEIKRHKAEIQASGPAEKINCIKCHYNLVHNEVDWDDKDEMLKGNSAN